MEEKKPIENKKTESLNDESLDQVAGGSRYPRGRIDPIEDPKTSVTKRRPGY